MPRSSGIEEPHYTEPDSTGGYTIVNCAAYTKVDPLTAEGPNYAEIGGPSATTAAYTEVNDPPTSGGPNYAEIGGPTATTGEYDIVKCPAYKATMSTSASKMEDASKSYVTQPEGEENVSGDYYVT